MGFPPLQLVLMSLFPCVPRLPGSSEIHICMPQRHRTVFSLEAASPSDGWIQMKQLLRFLGCSHILPLLTITVALQAQGQSAWGKATGNKGQEGMLYTIGSLHEGVFAQAGGSLTVEEVALAGMFSSQPFTQQTFVALWCKVCSLG